MTAKKASIVVADDDPRILRLVKRNLELAGYQALAAYDGEQALEQVEAKDPDLMLLDVNMPILNGFEVCERVRVFSTLPIIIVTARSGARSDSRDRSGSRRLPHQAVRRWGAACARACGVTTESMESR